MDCEALTEFMWPRIGTGTGLLWMWESSGSVNSGISRLDEDLLGS
jgi:hypothetical protein